MMKLTIASVFAGCLVYWNRTTHVQKPSGNGFLDIFATTQSSKTPADLVKIVRSERFMRMSDADLIDLLNEMVITLVQPRQSVEESIHVKSLLFAPIIRLQANGAIGGNDDAGQQGN